MRTLAIIAASLIGAATVVSGASAASGNDKAVRWQKEEQARMAHQDRMSSSRPMTTTRSTYGAPVRQSFGTRGAGQEQPAETTAPSALSMPGSGAPIYSYDADNTNRAYGY